MVIHMKKLYLLLIACFFVFFCCIEPYGVSADDSMFHCWKCNTGRQYYRSSTQNCYSCGWDICPYCGACSDGCNVKHPASSEYYKNQKLTILITLIILIVFAIWYIIFKINKEKLLFEWFEIGYNKNGYDKYGYDKDGYDKDGYDRDGYDRGGYDKDGYNKDGYNMRGLKKR